MATRAGHGAVLGLAYRGHGADWAELELPWRAALAGADGSAAAGAVLALLDVAASVAVWLARGVFAPQATLDLRLDRLRAGEPGRGIVGRCACARIADDVAFITGAAHDGDPARPLALVAGSFMLMAA
jgi:acyl-coenzyme A thioesterase PaaI-like protein